MKNEIKIDEKSTRTFATRETLESSAVYAELCDLRHVVVRTADSGRWTAIFVGDAAINRVLHGMTGKRFLIVG